MLLASCAAPFIYPPPNNPPSQTLACGEGRSCGGDQVCHVAISGGTCAASCVKNGQADDAQCGGWMAGLVCHAQIQGGVCAPNCLSGGFGLTGDRLCQQLGASFMCSASGRCVDRAPADQGRTNVRFLNLRPTVRTLSLQVEGDEQRLMTLTAPGALSAYQSTGAGTHTFKLINSTGQVMATLTQTLRLYSHYTVMAYEDARGALLLTIQEDDARVSPGADAAWLDYLQLSPSTELVNVAWRDSRESRLLFGSMALGEVREAKVVRPLVGNWSLSAASLPLLERAFTLKGDTKYSLITWPGVGDVLPEHLVITSEASPQAAGVALRSTGIRLANATADAPAIALYVDGQKLGQTTAVATLVANRGRYFVLPPGSHRIEIKSAEPGMQPLIVGEERQLEEGHPYTYVVYGARTAPSAVIVDESLPTPLAANEFAVRVVHAALNEGPLSLLQKSGMAESAWVNGPIAYGQASAPVTLPVTQSAPINVLARFAAPAADIASGPFSVVEGQRYLVLVSVEGSKRRSWIVTPQSVLQKD